MEGVLPARLLLRQFVEQENRDDVMKALADDEEER